VLRYALFIRAKGIALQDFRKLKVWDKAHALALAIYDSTSSFPSREQFGLTSQIRRAAGSIPANIAEGCGRTGDRELSRFAQIAMGSASELEYHLLLARDLTFLAPTAYDLLIQQLLEVKRMLAALIVKLRGGPIATAGASCLTD
jgi:four helix bundle protein